MGKQIRILEVVGGSSAAVPRLALNRGSHVFETELRLRCLCVDWYWLFPFSLPDLSPWRSPAQPPVEAWAQATTPSTARARPRSSAWARDPRARPHGA